jgi:hypothetical protein
MKALPANQIRKSYDQRNQQFQVTSGGYIRLNRIQNIQASLSTIAGRSARISRPRPLPISYANAFPQSTQRMYVGSPVGRRIRFTGVCGHEVFS